MTYSSPYIHKHFSHGHVPIVERPVEGACVFKHSNHIPYRQNRIVVFDSALYHKTDSFRFREGYENRRINLTLLFGKMRRGDDAPAAGEL